MYFPIRNLGVGPKSAPYTSIVAHFRQNVNSFLQRTLAKCAAPEKKLVIPRRFLNNAPKNDSTLCGVLPFCT